MASRTHSEAVYGPDGQRVQVLFYDDGSIRFRIYGAPWVIEEAFLTGNQQQNAIIKVAKPNPLPGSSRMQNPSR